MIQIDEQTIESIQEGDLTAFNEIIRFYQEQIYNFVYRIVQDRAIADDVTQNTFISAYRKIHLFAGGNFKAWLHRIAINAAYEEIRRLKKYEGGIPLNGSDDAQDEEERNIQLATPMETPEDHAQRLELRSQIERCFALLSEENRIAISLYLIEGYTYEEVAQIIDIPIGTVKSRINRARTMMRDCLAKHEAL